jgi:hypothetical protein
MHLLTLSVEGNIRFVRQGIALLERLTDDCYTRSRPGWSPVGTQYRHVLDHYRSFLLGLPEGRIDYDARLREAAVETHTARAIEVAESIVHDLASVSEHIGTQHLLVHMNSGGGEDAFDWCPSTGGRELQFLSSHTVHHYALIKLLLEDQGIDAGEDFGTAPSTLAYLRR